ncbi:uncharacterized protein LOC123300735 [Chrysoperla carnea]|uniref:uncharacterized protein LOC123300735 n=1 Tax=Chrysoperla carnea TaxID=189513 RepID=UPI001D05CB27|nr:uncharacterized protein LOC123300735 [Chrysoperla carnea]
MKMKFSAIFLLCFAVVALNTANSAPLNNTKHEVLLQRLRRQTQESVNQDLCAIFGVCDGQSGGNVGNNNNNQQNRPNVIPTNRPGRPNRPTSTRRPDVVLTDRPNRPGGGNQNRPIPTQRPNLPGGIPTNRPGQVSTSTPSTTVLGDEAYGRCITMCQGISNFNPVCGSDGVTYDNLSKLRCAASCGRPNVTQTRLGAC